ncbi:hypothetical protein ABZ604_31490 [Streptomyces sp. NPDC012473]|uniref:hypothetical protein n=1 Tax=Streptomyces sp. NPDC012473 TaxID=3156676 RepID=UPI0033EBB191
MSERTATGQDVLTQGTVVHCPYYVNGESTGLRKAVVLGLHNERRPQDGYRVYFYASGPADSFRRVAGHARHAEITSARKIPASPPVTHRFDSTGEASDAVQWDDSIADGDLIVVEPEGVVGFLELGWAVAITARTGRLAPLCAPAREAGDGRYVATYAAIAHVAHTLGFAIAPRHAFAVSTPVRAAAQEADATARCFLPVIANHENAEPIDWVYLVGRGDAAHHRWIAADSHAISAERYAFATDTADAARAARRTERPQHDPRNPAATQG